MAPTSDDKPVVVRMEPELVAWLDERAKATERTRSQVVRHFLRRVKAADEQGASANA